MRGLILCFALAALAGCTRNKFVNATAPMEGQEGTRAEAIIRGEQLRIENVGSYQSMPSDWTGPLPPGWNPNNVELARAEARKAEAEARKAEADLEIAKYRAATPLEDSRDE